MLRTQDLTQVSSPAYFRSRIFTPPPTSKPESFKNLWHPLNRGNCTWNLKKTKVEMMWLNQESRPGVPNCHTLTEPHAQMGQSLGSIVTDGDMLNCYNLFGVHSWW